MIPNYNNRQVESQGVEESREFGISINDSAHIMNILRNTIYSDKVLAVLREYSSNAWDAHVEAGKADVPIKVVLPTSLDPVLTIRDFGAGLSVDDMFTVFTKYGASTKRKSDSVVGMLGIGSKSGFAYSDNFTITSWNGGVKRIYVAVLDETEKGTLNLLDEEPCGEETGLQIQIPVKSADIWEFSRKAKELFKYYKPQPDINTELSHFGEGAVVLEQGLLSQDRFEGWVALMGCVPYAIDLDQLVSKDVPMVGKYVRNLGGALFFNIGELRVSSSREGLQYNEPTKVAIAKKFEALAEAYVSKTIADLTSSASDLWQLRVQAQIMNRMALPIPSDIASFVRESLDVVESPVFSFFRNGHEASKIDVAASTRVIIRDDLRDMAGFDLWGTTYVAKPKDPGHTVDEIQQAVLETLKAMGAEGLPVERTSNLTWTAPRRGRGGSAAKKRVDKKHHVRSFKLVDKPGFSYPPSADWAIVKREPTPDDVFVVIKGFKAGSGFAEMYRTDRAIAAAFGKAMPDIYAYKHKKGKPDEQFIGTPYTEWSKKFTAEMLTDDMRKLLNAIKWKDNSRLWRMTKGAKGRTKILGKNHVINMVVQRWKDAETYLKTVKEEHREFRASLLLDRFKDQFVPEIDTVTEELKKQYPLLFRHWSSMDVLWDKHESKDWIQYIRAIDHFNTIPEPEASDDAEAEVHPDE